MNLKDFKNLFHFAAVTEIPSLTHSSVTNYEAKFNGFRLVLHQEYVDAKFEVLPSYEVVQ